MAFLISTFSNSTTLSFYFDTKPQEALKASTFFFFFLTLVWEDG